MKKVISALLVLVLAVSVFIYAPPVKASAESLYIRKIVSVVFDDSGSMRGDKMAYASYAMKSFCGMLNSEDQLYITYMSEPGKTKKIDLSSGGIQKSVNDIKTEALSGTMTPYSTVETAYKHLRSVNDTNPNTQYWLVVISDGDFNDITDPSYQANKKAYLNKKFESYAEKNMPNGTKPQITFFGIGDKVTPPDENVSKGIFTFKAADEGQIISAMSEMADKISGRTRLGSNDITKLDDTTIQVNSSIPLLNVAVFVQGSEAKVIKASNNDGSDILISRKVAMSYPGYANLKGSAFLIGDSKNTINPGSYVITFDQPVNPNNVIVLFEPALEMRISIKLNGKEIKDINELNSAMENDKITVSCKVYEMGTDKEINPSDLPAGTKFEITVSEAGKVVESVTGKEMTLSDYVLKKIDTEIKAAITIGGFNPIERTVEINPVEYSSRIKYSIDASYGSDVKSVKFDKIASNKDLTVCFTVFADGKAITDPEAVKALKPEIKVSPDGNDGMITYANDGKIVFTPNSTKETKPNDGSYDVEVKCTITDPVNKEVLAESTPVSYTVLIAEYMVIPVEVKDVIRRNEWYGNKVGASFYVTKDGVRLGKGDVEKNISALLNEEYASSLKTDITVTADGTIAVTPYSTQEHKITFWNWWVNWYYYFGLESADATVTLNHPFGTVGSTIDVVAADAKYQILNVYLPLVLEILIIAAIVAYIVRYFTKARFASNGVLYVGSIARNRGTAGTHRLELIEIHLNQFNKFKNLWNPFKELTVSAGGVNITAAKGNRIICNEPFPWYSDGIRPKARMIRIESPKDVVNYCQENDELVIHEIKTVRVMDEQNRALSQDDSVYYFARADISYVKVGAKQTEVIDSAVAFCYSTIQN